MLKDGKSTDGICFFIQVVKEEACIYFLIL